jgi:hypothetical protein
VSSSSDAGQQPEPLVDLIIAVHTPQRRVERAVESVLSGTVAPVRVSVVCHGVDPALIAERLGALADDPRVRLLPFTDGIPSPTGPFNHGLDAATAAFTAVLGSDDELKPGAIDSWLRVQRKHSADVVIPRVGLEEGPSSLRTPPTRPFRSRDLDGAKDRLAYRTQQLGLVSRERFPTLRLTPGLRTGEDVDYGLKLWFSGARIAFDRQGPSYWGHQDATDRISVSLNSVADEFGFLDTALDREFTSTLSRAAREAIAVKFIRTHLMLTLAARVRAGVVDAADREALAGVARRIVELAPTSLQIVSRRDARIVRAVLAAIPDQRALADDLAVRTDYRRPANLLSAALRRLAHREAPPRFLAAVWLTP